MKVVKWDEVNYKMITVGDVIKHQIVCHHCGHVSESNAVEVIECNFHYSRGTNFIVDNDGDTQTWNVETGDIYLRKRQDKECY